MLQIKQKSSSANTYNDIDELLKILLLPSFPCPTVILKLFVNTINIILTLHCGSA